jgi:mono/diheme cytochrome c family protein
MTPTRAIRRVMSTVIALCTLVAAAHGQTRPDIARRQSVAQRLCAGCHAIDNGTGGTYQKTDVPSFRAIANRPNRSRERIEAFIMTPHPPMPAVPLTLAEITDLTAYILSLK